jgi:hypothetical protein
MANIQLASQEWVSEQLSGQTSILTLKKKLIGNDTPTELSGLTGNNNQTISVIIFNNTTYIYYLKSIYDPNPSISLAYISGAVYNSETYIASNEFVAVDYNLLGDRNLNCSYVFVYNSKVYMLVNSYTTSYCYLLESIDGIIFTIVSNNLADIPSNFKNGMYGNHCLIPYRIDGYFYWFIEGREGTGSGDPWIMKLMKSTTFDSEWELVGLVNNLTHIGGSRGGSEVRYDNGKFKMIYHYSVGANPPSMIAYAEADINDPLNFTVEYYPLLGITRNPYPNTDQIADPTIVEIKGKTYMFAEYVDNALRLGSIYAWESPYRIYDILNSPLTDENPIT